MFRFFISDAHGQLVNKIWYIKRSLQVGMCFPLGGAGFKVKISIGSGPSFAICVFSVILTFHSNARSVSARVSRFFTIGSSHYCCKCARVVVGVVLFFLSARIHLCCRRSLLLLKVRLSPSSVLKVVLFLSARVRLVVYGRRYC